MSQSHLRRLRSLMVLFGLGVGAAHAQTTDNAAQSTASSKAAEDPAVASPASSAPGGLSPICSDRPTKSNGACTVDAGHFQYESDIFNGSFMRLYGVTADTYFALNPTLKYGLTSQIDVEVNISPAEIIRTRDTTGAVNTISGVSDLFLRLKYEFLNIKDGVLQAAILPYVKAPTARMGLGNGAVEAGLTVPISYKLNSLVTLTSDPEVDLLKNANDSGRHLNTVQLVSAGFSLPKNVTLYGELWGDWDFDPTGVVRQYSADTAISYGVTNYLQVDAGLNFGLNRFTPGVQLYFGVSQKF